MHAGKRRVGAADVIRLTQPPPSPPTPPPAPHTDDWEGLFANGDSTYLVANSIFEADPNGPVYIMSKITGRMPLVPTGLEKGPRYVDTPDAYDVRYCESSRSLWVVLDGMGWDGSAGGALLTSFDH